MSNDNPRKTLSLKREATPAQPAIPAIEERLHKVLAQAGLGSRRSLEERISRGEVKVNGEVAELGRVIKGGDRIELDGKTFMATALTEPAAVLLYNKPEGQVTTREDPEGRPTIFEALPRLKGARWIAVGRLDINTTGLLLLTTDGELANALMHPSSGVEREYVCRIHGEVPEAVIEKLKRGVQLDDGPAKFDEIEAIGSSDSHAWFRVVIKEGRNREVRRLWDSQGFQVSRLKRVRYGNVVLPRELLRGQSVEMPTEQVEALRREFKLADQAPVLTLQPVIGQRRASGKQAIEVRRDQRGPSYVNGALDQEERELRRFDHVREERPARGRGRPGGKVYGKKGAKAFVGPMGADAPVGGRGAGPGGGKPFGKKPFGKKPFGANAEGGTAAGANKPWGDRPAKPGQSKPYAGRGGKPFGEKSFGDKPAGAGGKPFGGKPRGPKAAAGGVDSASGAFRSWYVPEGVDTGSKVAPPRKQRGDRPFGKPAGDGGFNRGPRGEGGPARGPRGPGGGGQGARGPGGGGPRGPGGPGGGNGPRGGQRKPGRGGHGPRIPEGAPDID